MTDKLQELAQSLVDVAKPPKVAPPGPPVPVAKARYSHEAMVDLMVEQPSWTHAQLAGHFGRPASWLSSVLASDAFQQVLELRRHEVADPSLTATMEERFRALAMRSTTVLQEKLNSAGVADATVIAAVQVATKALGLGMKPQEPLQLPAPGTSSETVAEKLLRTMDELDKARESRRTVDVETVEVRDVS